MKINPGSAANVSITGDVSVQQLGVNTLTSINPITIANTATEILAAAATTARVYIKAAKTNGEEVYLGDSGLTDPGTTEDGFPLAAGEGVELVVSAAVYGISNTGSQKVYVMYAGEV